MMRRYIRFWLVVVIFGDMILMTCHAMIFTGIRPGQNNIMPAEITAKTDDWLQKQTMTGNKLFG